MKQRACLISLALGCALAAGCGREAVRPEPQPTPPPAPVATPAPTAGVPVRIDRVTIKPKSLRAGEVLSLVAEVRLQSRRSVTQRNWIAKASDKKRSPIFPPESQTFVPEKMSLTQVWEVEIPPGTAPGAYVAIVEIRSGKASRQASRDFTIQE